MSHCVYIGIGSNLDSPLKHVNGAIQDLHQLSNTFVEKASKLYRNPPLYSDELPLPSSPYPEFINAVVKLITSLSPLELLVQLQGIEKKHGRKRIEHWGPRTLDLDMLLYDNLQMNTPGLCIPHPGLKIRNFVVLPLYSIEPTLILPDKTSLKDLVKNFSFNDLIAIESEEYAA